MPKQLPLTKVCRKCGIEKPSTQFNKDKRYADGLQSWCHECYRAYHLQQKQDPAKAKRISERSKEWYAQNKERLIPMRRARDVDRWHNDPEYHARKNRWKVEHFRNDPIFRAKKMLSSLFARRKRRARLLDAEGSYTESEWNELCAKYDYRCLCCGERKPLTADHVVPLACGGSNSIDNVQPLCDRCNKRKHTKTIDYRPDRGGR